MDKLQHIEVLVFLVQVSIMLISARIFGELIKKIKQPAVIGEIIAGIVLGPSIFGYILPDFHSLLFYDYPKAYIGYDSLASVGVIFLLFVAGMEVNLPMIWKNGKSALSISISGIVFPFALGFFSGWYLFDIFSDNNQEQKVVFSLFLGVALSISALPVIAKILLDLKLLKHRIGSLILASAMIDDILGWILFSVILSMMQSEATSYSISNILFSVGYTIAFTAIILSVGRILINKLIPIFYKYISGTSGVITFAISMCFMGAVFTEYIGIHGIFGAFLMGIAFGDSEHFSEKPREILHLFITNIFAPLFFASIGLKINFVENFDLTVVFLVVVLSYIAKLVGVGFGARISGLKRNEALAISFGMNARGSMAIILGILALEAHIINDKMFVAIVIMAIITSITSGPFMKFFLKNVKN